MQSGSVFQVVDSLRTGGTERMAVNVSNGLAERGWDVHLFATRELGPLAADVDDGVELHALARRSRWDLDGIRAFRRAVTTGRPEIVHCHGWSTMRFATAAMTGLRRAPALVLHDHHPRSGPMAWHYRAAAWVRTSSRIAVDEALLSPPLRTLHRSVELAIPNGVPLSEFPSKASYGLGMEPRIIALANLRSPKGHEVLVRALAKVQASGLRARVDLVGAPSDAAYAARVRFLSTSLGVDQAVHELGLRSDTATLLPTYDIGVVPSLAESGPLVLIEYLAAGLPFVTTDTGAIPAMLPPDLRAWVVPVDDPDALACRMIDLLSLSPEQRASIGARARKFAQDNLSMDRTVDAIENVYRRLC